MKVIKKIFEDKARVGVMIVCLLILFIMISNLVIDDTFALNTNTGVKNLKYYNQGNYSGVKFCSGSYNVAKNGCGATSLAVIASSFTSSKYDPKYVANWICNHGHDGGGISWKYLTMEEMLDDFELELETLFKKTGKIKGNAGKTYDSTEGNAILNAVKQGKGIVLHIPGHYVAVGPNEQCSSNEVYYYNVGRSYENGCYTPKALFNKTYNYKDRCSNDGNCGWKAAFAYNSKSETNYKVRVYFNANGAQLGNDNYYLDSNNNILKVSNESKYYKEYEYTDTGIDLPNYSGTTFKMSYKGYKNASPFWNTKADGSGEKIYQTKGMQDAKELCNASSSDCSVTLYGQWKPIEYQIHYEGNGNTGENYTVGHCSASGKCGLDVYTSGTTYEDNIFKHATKHNYDTEVVLRKNRFIKEGYTFAGWATSSTGNVKYTNQDVVTNLSYEDGSIVKLYAQWKANIYTIKYNGNKNDGGTTADSTHTYGQLKSLTSNGYTKTGYTFTAWNTKPDGSGVSYKDGQSVKNLVTNGDGTLTLYAQWMEKNNTNTDNKEKITYYVKYDSNDGIGTMSNSTHIYNEGSNLTTNTFTRDSYVFDSWNTAKNGTGKSYVDGQTVSDLASNDGTTLTLYAQWIKEESEEKDDVKENDDSIDNNTEDEVEDKSEDEILDAEEEPGDAKEDIEENDSNQNNNNIEDPPKTGSLATIIVALIAIGTLAISCFIVRK